MSDRRITGNFVSLIQLSPEVRVHLDDRPGIYRFTIGNTEFSISSEARIRPTASTWYPQFGAPIKTEKLVLSNHQAEAIDYVITWKTT